MPRFKFDGMFAALSKMCFTIPVIAVEGAAFPTRSIKTFWSKVIAASSISQQFLMSPVDYNDYAAKWGLHGISPLKYRALLLLSGGNTSHANQAGSLSKPAEIFSQFAVDKPVEKQIFFELPHCFLT